MPAITGPTKVTGSCDMICVVYPMNDSDSNNIKTHPFVHVIKMSS